MLLWRADPGACQHCKNAPLSVKAGSHIYRHKDKYGFAALGAGAALAAQKGVNKIKSAFD